MLALTADVELENGRGGITGAPLPPGKYILVEVVKMLLPETCLSLDRVVKLLGNENEDTRAAAPGRGIGRRCRSDVRSALVILL